MRAGRRNYARRTRCRKSSAIGKGGRRILLLGTQPIIGCPARSLTNMLVPLEWQRAMEKGRLLLVSPFDGSQERATAELAQERNKFVATVADRVCFIYTTPRSTLETLAAERGPRRLSGTVPTRVRWRRSSGSNRCTSTGRRRLRPQRRCSADGAGGQWRRSSR